MQGLRAGGNLDATAFEKNNKKTLQIVPVTGSVKTGKQSSSNIKKMRQRCPSSASAVPKDEEAKFSFWITRNAFLAKAIGTKAEKLNSDAALHNLLVEDTVSFELQAARAARDWSNVPGKETKCKILNTFASNATDVPAIDNDETVWQLNWVQVIEPSQDDSIKTKDGSRPWFPITLRDDSESIVLYITEQAAVKLANVSDAPKFEQLHSEGRLRFPFWASVKVWSRPHKPSAVQPDKSEPQQQGNDFWCPV